MILAAAAAADTADAAAAAAADAADAVWGGKWLLRRRSGVVRW